MRFVFEMVLEFLLRLSGFFDYWILKSNENGNKARAIILNTVFSIASSFLISIVILIVLVPMYVIFINKAINPNVNVIIWATFFITSFWMLLIIYLNWKQDVNLPQIILEFIAITMFLKEKRKAFGFLEMGLFITISTFIGTSLSFWIIYSFTNSSIGVYQTIIIITVNLLLVVALYSEFSMDEIERSIRQLNLWIIVFCVLLALTLYELKGFVESSDISIISTGLLIFGLVYNVATIADKTRIFLTLSKREFGEKIIITRQNLHEEFSNKIQVEEYVEIYNYVKQLWANGDIKTRTKILLVFVASFTFIISMLSISFYLT